MSESTGRRRSNFPDKRRASGGFNPPRRLTHAEVQKRYRERLKQKQLQCALEGCNFTRAEHGPVELGYKADHLFEMME